jgi:hypothetical protein
VGEGFLAGFSPDFSSGFFLKNFWHYPELHNLGFLPEKS